MTRAANSGRKVWLWHQAWFGKSATGYEMYQGFEIKLVPKHVRLMQEAKLIETSKPIQTCGDATQLKSQSMEHES